MAGAVRQVAMVDSVQPDRVPATLHEAILMLRQSGLNGPRWEKMARQWWAEKRSQAAPGERVDALTNSVYDNLDFFEG
jgi:hypothetical protein